MKNSLMEEEVIYIENDMYRPEEERIQVSGRIGEKVYGVSLLTSPQQAIQERLPVNSKDEGIRMLTNTFNYVKKYGAEAFEKVSNGEAFPHDVSDIPHDYKVIDLTVGE